MPLRHSFALVLVFLHVFVLLCAFTPAEAASSHHHYRRRAKQLTVIHVKPKTVTSESENDSVISLEKSSGPFVKTKPENIFVDDFDVVDLPSEGLNDEPSSSLVDSGSNLALTYAVLLAHPDFHVDAVNWQYYLEGIGFPPSNILKFYPSKSGTETVSNSKPVDTTHELTDKVRHFFHISNPASVRRHHNVDILTCLTHVFVAKACEGLENTIDGNKIESSCCAVALPNKPERVLFSLSGHGIGLSSVKNSNMVFISNNDKMGALPVNKIYKLMTQALPDTQFLTLIDACYAKTIAAWVFNEKWIKSKKDTTDKELVVADEFEKEELDVPKNTILAWNSNEVETSTSDKTGGQFSNFMLAYFKRAFKRMLKGEKVEKYESMILKPWGITRFILNASPQHAGIVNGDHLPEFVEGFLGGLVPSRQKKKLLK